ncbi:MAG: metabolite traffic protein EboE [Bacteroidota bacterium]
MNTNGAHHLTYCTNIHPGQDWRTTLSSLKQFVPKIKAKVSPDKPFGLGLRLSNTASEELGRGSNFQEFRDWLAQNDVYVFTMNGFPYGNFHNERVKEQVHAPDWTTRERVTYTKRLFEQLAALLPEGMSGGISTSPISYKHWHANESTKEKAFRRGADHLTEIIAQLYHLEQKTGKYLHLDIEPEPDGLLENTQEVLDFFNKYLVPIAVEGLKDSFGNSEGNLEKVIKRYITLCYDICHFSLAYEEPEDTFQKLNDVGIRVGKIQISAALKILSNKKDNAVIWDNLAQFNEPTYLHQVTEKVGDTVKTYNDLPIILVPKKDFEELRAHFHVPIFLERFGTLFSTQDHILKVMDYLKRHPGISEHLEIETYTWEVLPKNLKRELSDSIVREIKWVKERL